MHVALALVCLAVVLNLDLIRNLDYGILLLIFCMTLVGYNITKYAHLWLARKSFLFKLPITIITAICGLLSAILIIPVLSIELVFLLSLIAIIGLSYTFPIYKGKSLRHFPVVKLISVSVIWVIIIFPLFKALTIPNPDYLPNNWSTFYLIGYRDFKPFLQFQTFIYVFALCIPFEIRDLKYDEENLKTLPQLIGVRRSKLLGVFLCIITLIIETILFQYFETGSIFNTIFFVITAMMIWFSSPKRSDYYASFWVEGIPILWLLVVLLFA